MKSERGLRDSFHSLFCKEVSEITLEGNFKNLYIAKASGQGASSDHEAQELLRKKEGRPLLLPRGVPRPGYTRVVTRASGYFALPTAAFPAIKMAYKL